MSLTPVGIVKVGTRAALRRRYGWAALRVMRRTIRKALQTHRERMLDPSKPYSGDELAIRAAYFRGMARIRERWPNVNPLDPRAEP